MYMCVCAMGAASVNTSSAPPLPCLPLSFPHCSGARKWFIVFSFLFCMRIGSCFLFWSSHLVYTLPSPPSPLTRAHSFLDTQSGVGVPLSGFVPPPPPLRSPRKPFAVSLSLCVCVRAYFHCRFFLGSGSAWARDMKGMGAAARLPSPDSMCMWGWVDTGRCDNTHGAVCPPPTPLVMRAM